MSHPMPSHMRAQHNFSTVPEANIQRSRFDRSHAYKTTFNEGYLVPFYVDEALPGDTFNLRATLFARLATPITPIMDNLYISTFFFFVPNRLLWDNWQKFMGEQLNPGDSISYLVPQMTSPAGTGFVPPTDWTAPTTAQLSSALFDYMGIPTKVPGLPFDNLHGRAYNFTWNQCFRDQNLQNSVVVNKGDGPDTYTDYVLLKRGKRHDYFTSALPFVQKGPAVSIPLGTQAPVKGIGLNSAVGAGSSATVFETGTPGTTTFNWAVNANTAGQVFINQVSAGDRHPNIYADLTAAAAATINSLRQAATLQQFLERDARGGTRYIEIILSHFNVHSPDARLQRPEFLGGTTVRLDITQVPQTSAVPSQPTPQGNLAAYGTALVNGNRNGFYKSFVEHGVLIGLCCVHADLTYQQGLDRMWSRQTRYDFYWPTFAHLGEQSILNMEIYAVGTATPGQDVAVFGYQERYAEYRYKPSKITGLFRSNATGTLDYWHLSQNFATLPVLGNTFISENPPVARVVAVPSQPHFILDAYINLDCARPMPLYSVPGLMRF